MAATPAPAPTKRVINFAGAAARQLTGSLSQIDQAANAAATAAFNSVTASQGYHPNQDADTATLAAATQAATTARQAALQAGQAAGLSGAAGSAAPPPAASQPSAPASTAPNTIAGALATATPPVAAASSPVAAAATSSSTMQWLIGLAVVAGLGWLVIRHKHPAPAPPK